MKNHPKLYKWVGALGVYLFAMAALWALLRTPFSAFLLRTQGMTQSELPELPGSPAFVLPLTVVTLCAGICAAWLTRRAAGDAVLPLNARWCTALRVVLGVMLVSDVLFCFGYLVDLPALGIAQLATWLLDTSYQQAMRFLQFTSTGWYYYLVDYFVVHQVIVFFTVYGFARLWRVHARQPAVSVA